MHFEQTQALYEPADRTSPVYLVESTRGGGVSPFHGVDSAVSGLFGLGLVRSQEALAAAYELGHAVATSQALYLTCWLHQIEPKPDRSFPPRLDSVDPVQSGRIADLLGHDHQGSVDRAL